MKAKTFDCVEMKHKGGLRIFEETKDLSLAQKVEYWQRKNEKAMEKHIKRAGQIKSAGSR